MHHLTSRWAALRTAANEPVFIVTFLVSRSSGMTPDDYLGTAVAGFPVDLLSADVTRGELCSIRLRFLAPDEDTARQWGAGAMRECARHAHFTDALSVRRGRMTAMERQSSTYLIEDLLDDRVV